MSVMSADTTKTMLGIFGGTFDPVHIGHLQPVAEAAQELGLEQVRLLPCHIPPHKQAPQSSPEHRLAMLELACQQWPLFIIDNRELMWDKPSYSIDTLKDFRREFANRPVLFFIGMDSLCHLDSWYKWQSICKYCHLVVCQRGDFLPEFNVNITRLLNERRTTDVKQLEQHSGGYIYLAKTSQIPVSSTTIRAALSHGDVEPSWLPEKVQDYIERHQLYRQCE
ncbi:nicotinate-nucleotide adenylyltransferase [Lacimicrobium alkaliphilum]|uniref:Probable nicotinate-nucleotide adenylyltransferase n=1 Tax=Lacimicrobium alkaliphilum TaxID=1526571 RepID=A0ABQ1RRM6_9ALTE|nr:nicotinate-nucleotide adenylyltransferase [Lacimicrobium alkaliphilum]GGD75824.1 putative nicotinate-nucleotide adenylyltransferase [Lacimicrobium alkaliphilum]